MQTFIASRREINTRFSKCTLHAGCSVVKSTEGRHAANQSSSHPPPPPPRTTKHPQQDFLLHVAMAAKVGRVRLQAARRWLWPPSGDDAAFIVEHIVLTITWGLFCWWRLMDNDLHLCLFGFSPVDRATNNLYVCVCVCFDPESISTGRLFPAQHLSALLTPHRSPLSSPSHPPRLHHHIHRPVCSSAQPPSPLFDCLSSVLWFTVITRVDSGY